MSKKILLVFFALPFLIFTKISHASADVTCGGVVVKGSVCPRDATGCDNKGSVTFLGLPTWYTYLKLDDRQITDNKTGVVSTVCSPQLSCDSGSGPSDTCNAQSGIDISKLWLIVLAILELLLRLGGLLTVAMVIFGGVKYITSQGQPDATKNARQTILNALIGMAITTIASISVNFIANIIK